MISVIIPTLNEEKLIASFLKQFEPEVLREFDLEVIISDGGSADCTIDIASSFGVKIVEDKNSQRQTIAQGRNLGARQANGDIFVFLNADTRFDDAKKFFLRVKETMSDSSVLAATCAVHIFPEEGRIIDLIFHYLHNGYCRLLNVIGEGMGRGECHIVRRSIFEKVGGYNESMAAGEDYDLYRRIRKHGRIAFLKKTILFESPRRFRKYGYGHIVWDWTRNAIAVVVKNKSSSKKWDAVR